MLIVNLNDKKELLGLFLECKKAEKNITEYEKMLYFFQERIHHVDIMNPTPEEEDYIEIANYLKSEIKVEKEFINDVDSRYCKNSQLLTRNDITFKEDFGGARVSN